MTLPQIPLLIFNILIMKNLDAVRENLTTLEKSSMDAPAWLNLRKWLKVLQWVLPMAMFGLVVVYELVAARWFQLNMGEQFHYLAEILFYGTIGPALAFILLHFLGRWLEEKETSDLQAKLLAQAREYTGVSNKLNDDALQTLFAVRVLINSLQAGLKKQDRELAALLNNTESTLETAIKELREHLEHQPPASFPIRANGSGG
jgi:signal transduction histidine kinase